ncbi:MAG: HipA family kinase [Chloroflexota bacterium]
MDAPVATMPHRTATRYVTPLREGGSLPGLVEADDDGLYVVKFRGAGQGPRALVAEWIAGSLARAIGLDVPEIVAIDVDAHLGDAEPDEEIHDLVRASGGTNLGLDFLPGALPFNPAARPVVRAEMAADVVWLDALVTNPDRTVANPNLLVWHGRIWLIDHGAAFYVHHTWREPDAHAVRPFERIRDHVLLPYAGSIQDADARLAVLLDRDRIAGIVSAIPDAWLPNDATAGDAADQRQAYVRYLERRLAPPRHFVQEAERARHAA